MSHAARAIQAARTGLFVNIILVIVKLLVEMHDGHVTVDSVLNQGTTVSVFLPVHQNATAR